ncbi:unnamed protein product [Rotaria sp. Silwood2]|nr:unnamed protein product [Rotaria sp. Silwood2]
MVFQTSTTIFRYIQNAFTLTEKDQLKLKNLAQNYNCEINKINIETKKELIILPKEKNVTTSKYITNESNQYYFSLAIWRKLSMSHNTIEIHKSYGLIVDITIISTTAYGIKEKIDPKYGNGYFESDTGKRIYQIDKQNTQQQCLDLIGSIASVNQAKQKYELMSDIERQRILLYTDKSECDGQLSTSSTQISDSYNIILNCCFDDKILVRHLANSLADEGYHVSMTFSDKTPSTIGSKFNKTYLIIICFSSNYSENSNCMTSLNITISSGKEYLPIMLMRSSLNHDDN